MKLSDMYHWLITHGWSQNELELLDNEELIALYNENNGNA